MLGIEERLRRRGEAVESELVDEEDERRLDAGSRPHPRRRVLLTAGVTLVGVLGVAAWALLGGKDEGSVVSTETPATNAGSRAGVFSTPTETVLVFSDGIDGVTAIDLDRRVAGRRVIEGERAGDQPFRLTLTGGHVIVGWGDIYAMPLGGGPAKKVADATIYIPASEPGEVWTLAEEGGRIGVGEATLQRVRVDGTVAFTSTTFDAVTFEPVIGVPGGLAVNTAEGFAVWDAETGTLGPLLGRGRATSATSDGRSLAWCEGDCREYHAAPLDRTGPPTAPHVAPGAQRLTFSPDGTYLGVLRASRDGADLVVARPETGEEAIVARGLDPSAALVWAADGRQLFYAESSYVEASQRIGRYDTGTRRWEIHYVPVGDGLAPIALGRAQARSFFSEPLVPAEECRGAGGSYPSGRHGVCSFTFSMRD